MLRLLLRRLAARGLQQRNFGASCQLYQAPEVQSLAREIIEETAGGSSSPGFWRERFFAISQLPTAQQRSLEQLLETEGLGQLDLLVNIRLQILLAAGTDSSRVFNYITENLLHALDNGLLEVFALRLVAEDNLDAASALLHILIGKANFKPSNQLWGYFTSKACELGHNTGSLLVFSEVVDPSKFYGVDEYSPYLENSYIPFLLTPKTLALLALVYSRSGNSAAVVGLTAYFKRFYSYKGHSDVLKALNIALVEAHSAQGNIGSALKTFRNLCFRFKDHQNNVAAEKGNLWLNSTGFNSFRQRRQKIKQKIYIPESLIDLTSKVDAEQDLLAEELDVIPFRPHIERNLYRLGMSRKFVPIIHGGLKVADLPQFYRMIKTRLALSKASINTADLIAEINSNHYMLHVFMVAALSELNCIHEACTILVRLPVYNRYLVPSTLYREDDFIYVFRAIYSQLQALRGASTAEATSQRTGLTKVLLQLKKVCDNVMENSLSSSQAYAYFFDCLLDDPATDPELVLQQLQLTAKPCLVPESTKRKLERKVPASSKLIRVQ